MPSLHHDQPASDDTLQRRPFAEKIAVVIASQTEASPLVISINGAWGEGKSTVFGFLKTALDGRNVQCVCFNPWRYPNEDDLLCAFFSELAKEIGVELLEKKEKAAKKSGWFGSALKAVPVVGGAASELFEKGGRWLTPTIEALRGRLMTKLRDTKKRVAVLLDDPDRLDTDEMFALFRLIKLTADLDYVTFVLAMDYDAVAKVVGTRFGGDDQGRRFLEKIVQVPIRLPAVPHVKLREFTLQLVQEVMSDLKIELGQLEVNRFRGAFDTALMPLIRTPRAAKQYANVLRFGLGLLPGEVNTVDVMLLEGIRIFMPDLFVRISNHLVPSTAGNWFDDIMLGREDRAKLLADKLLPPGVDEETRDQIRSLLTELFAGKLNEIGVGEATFLQWTREKRVACDEYLIRYFAAVVPENDVPDADVDNWSEIATKSETDSLAAALKESLSLKTEVIFVQKLRRIEKHLNDRQRKCFAEAIGKISDSFSKRDVAWQGDTAMGQAAIFASECIANMRELADREPAASAILCKASSAMWAIQVFYFLPHDRENERNELTDEQKARIFPKEVSARLGSIIADRLMSGLETAQERPSVEFLFHACRLIIKHGDKALLREWSKRELERDQNFLKSFAVLFAQWSYINNAQRHYEWIGDEKVLSSISDYVDADWLAKTFSPPKPAEGKGLGHGISEEEAAYRLIELLKRPKEDTAPTAIPGAE